MEWSDRARSIWGKTDRETHAWMPLVQHLEDSAAVADELYQHFLPESVRALLRDLLDADDSELRAMVRWLAGAHDLGKATPEFTCQIRLEYPELLGAMRDHGLPAPSIPQAFGHPALGQVLMEQWLAQFTPARHAAASYACVIGGHHGRNPSATVLRAARLSPINLGAQGWPLAQRELLDGVACFTGAEPYLAKWMQHSLPIQVQVLLTGLVIAADWIASNQLYFEYTHGPVSPDRSAEGWERVGLPSSWEPHPRGEPSTLFGDRFPRLAGARPNALQAALTDSGATVTAPGLWIVEAPMGVGKTEAALLAAEVIASRFGNGGVFFGLPTMATANPMFDRVLSWLETAVGSHDAAVSLAHGKAGLNDSYRGLLRESWSGSIHDEDEDQPQAMVHSWLRGPKRTGLANFVVGTIDQGLFGALKAKHVALRHLSLAGKVIVIDEVHAADTYMRHYLRRLLTWLGAYRTPVILMSATLPPDQRDEYLSAYAEGLGELEIEPTDRADTYPRISFCNSSHPVSVPVPTTPSNQVHRLNRIDDSEQTLASLLRAELAEGGCAGVICNTVTRAQQVFMALQTEFGDEVALIHSRFLAPDRARKERELADRLGPRGERPHRLIVVGTQVLEQSLDVDFDLMVTDVAPIDLVLQRAGRLHRHHRHRPKPLADPVLHLRGVEDWDALPPTVVSGSRRVYGASSLLRALAVLGDRDRIELPADVPTLVRLGYDPELAPPPGWEEAWGQAAQQQQVREQRAAARASTYLLDSPRVHRNLNSWIDVDAQDPDKSEAQGRSQVRDSEDSLEVIVAVRDQAGALRVPSSAPSHAEALIPTTLTATLSSDNALARALASCTLPLPLVMSHPGVFDQVLTALERGIDASGWQTSPWLKGQLVLPLDHQGSATVGPFTLHYNPNTGLTVTQQEEA